MQHRRTGRNRVHGIGKLLRRHVVKQVPGHTALEQPRDPLRRWVIRHDHDTASSRQDGVEYHVELLARERTRRNRHVGELTATERDELFRTGRLTHNMDTVAGTGAPQQAALEQVVLAENDARLGGHRRET